MKHSFIELPTVQQALTLVEHGDLLATNCYHSYAVFLYNYQVEFWELVYDNNLKRAVLVRRVTPGILQEYLDSIKLPKF